MPSANAAGAAASKAGTAEEAATFEHKDLGPRMLGGGTNAGLLDDKNARTPRSRRAGTAMLPERAIAFQAPNGCRKPEYAAGGS